MVAVKANVLPPGKDSYVGSLTDREYIRLQTNQLKLSRVSYESQMRLIADQLLSYRLRLQLSDYDRGDRKNSRMYDSTAAFAIETLENGWLSAASDQATNWFSLTDRDTDLAAWGPHKEWYDASTDILLGMLAESNAYVTLGTFYGNNAGFGTAVMSVEEGDLKGGPAIDTAVINTGSYWLGQDPYGNPDTYYEELRMTVRQVYEQFGGTAEWSTFMKTSIDKGRWEQWIDVGHMIQPNVYYNPGMSFSGSKPYSSWWFELGTTATSGTYGYVDSIIQQNAFLRKGGYDTFPIIVARYEMMRGEVYGVDCPGMKAVGDILSLQSYERRTAQYLEKGINPHWLAPDSLVGQADHGFIPGLTTYLPAGEQAALRPAFNVDPRFMEPAGVKGSEIRTRLGKAFSTDLFQLFDSLPDKQRTATEIMQRKSEKLSKLGKPYANLQHYTYRPMINRLFYIALKRNMLPPAPPDLQGREIMYAFNGILAQAQKMARFSPITTMFTLVQEAAAATGGPQSPVWDVFNMDAAIEHSGDALQLPADIVNPPDKVQAIRAEKAKQAAMQQKLAMAEQASKAAKNFAQAPTDGNNALTALAGAGAQGQ